MSAKLGGWWRLWIALSLIYGSVIGVYAWTTFPTLTSVEHEHQYLSLMSQQAQDILSIKPKPLPPKVAAEYRSFLDQINDGLLGDQPDTVSLQMVNAHKFNVAAHVTENQKSTVFREYTRVLESALFKLRLQKAIEAFLVWLLPALLLCVLGLAVRWIHHGFRQ